MTIDIRQVAGDEFLDVMVRVAGYAFEASPPGANRAEWEEHNEVDDATHFAVYEDGKAVTVVSSTPMRVNVRGKLFPVGGVWGVASDPMVRRKGYVRQALTRLFAALHDDGMPISTLYPFRESFYDRLGYVTFPQPRMATIDSSALLPLMKWNLQGSFELLSIADGYDRYRAFLERQQQQIHGMGLFGIGAAHAVRKANRVWLLVAEVDGEEVGMMTYRIEGQGKNLVSRAFFPVDTRGRYLLLEWLARHADQVKDIELKLPPSMQPETWLPDLNVKIAAGYPPMGRVVDVAGLEGMQSGNARFTAGITDAHCPWNAGIFAFDSSESVLHVTPTAVAECNLTIQGLTALIYGSHDPADFALRGWGDPSPAVQARMRTLFPAMLPYLHEVF